MSATVVVVTATGGARLVRLLASLEAQTTAAQVLVVDNACPEGALAEARARFPGVGFVSAAENVGFGRAVNLAAARADGDALVLVNDDCVCEPVFVEALSAALDPAAGIVMAAGVLAEARDPRLIDTAGMELDSTLLVFDYLNGRPIDLLAGPVPDPIGPCGAAAAFDRDAFLAAGGFDEALFAYWEDVDLVLRLRREGARCALAAGARGVHEHSATLGSGSARKNYLVGFGRGYVLRKWSVLASPPRAARALVRDLVLSGGQAVVDRTLAGARGRLDGWAAARSVPAEPYPAAVLQDAPGLGSTLTRRLRRRARLRPRAARRVAS